MILCKIQKRLSEKVRLLSWIDGAVLEQNAINRLKLLSNRAFSIRLESLPNVEQQDDEVLWPVQQNACGSREELSLIFQAIASVGYQAVPPYGPNNEQHRPQVHRHELIPRERKRILVICREAEDLLSNDVEKGCIRLRKWRQHAFH
jgi:hypothetical protein